jgi:hypothetical protein
MDYTILLSQIDKVAGDLENKGLLKEAEMLDAIANTLEKGGIYDKIDLDNKLVDLATSMGFYQSDGRFNESSFRINKNAWDTIYIFEYQKFGVAVIANLDNTYNLKVAAIILEPKNYNFEDAPNYDLGYLDGQLSITDTGYADNSIDKIKAILKETKKEIDAILTKENGKTKWPDYSIKRIPNHPFAGKPAKSANDIISSLDKVAGDLENRGLLKEAEMLDIAANTIEKEAYAAFEKEAYELLKGQGYYDALQQAIDTIEAGIKSNNISKILNGFSFVSGEPFRKIKEHFKKAKSNIYKNMVSNEFSALTQSLENIEEKLTKAIDEKDTGVATEVLEDLKGLKDMWEKLAPAIDKKQFNK